MVYRDPLLTLENERLVAAEPEKNYHRYIHLTLAGSETVFTVPYISVFTDVQKY